MHIIQNPNGWSCLPTAAAIVLDVSFEQIIKAIGHDGSEIANSCLPDPTCRKGFHIQEIVKVCLRMHLSLTPVEMYPRAAAKHPTVKTSPKLFDIGGWDWFYHNLQQSHGIIECHTSKGFGHALAYDNTTIYDPGNSKVFQVSTLNDFEQYNRFPFKLWRLGGVL